VAVIIDESLRRVVEKEVRSAGYGPILFLWSVMMGP